MRFPNPKKSSINYVDFYIKFLKHKKDFLETILLFRIQNKITIREN